MKNQTDMMNRAFKRAMEKPDSELPVGVSPDSNRPPFVKRRGGR